MSVCPSTTRVKTNLNGKFCWPKSNKILSNLSLEDRISNRYFFFLEYDKFYLILAAALVLSILFYALMRCCPGPMMHFTFFLSAFGEIILAVVFSLYTHQGTVAFAIVGAIMLIGFFLSFFQIILYR